MKSLWAAASAATCGRTLLPVGAEYFRDADAKEDAEPEEKFIPKTYNGKAPKAGKKEKSKKTEPKPAPKPADEEQLTFGDFGTEEAAG